MRWTARAAAALLISVAGATSFAGVAEASEIGSGISTAPASAHFSHRDHRDHRDHHVGLLGGVAQGVGGLLHGVGQTLHPLLRGLL